MNLLVFGCIDDRDEISLKEYHLTMDGLQTNALVEIGTRLTELAVRGTVSAVSKRIHALRVEKDIEMIRNKYEEIVNELLAEREEAIRIAQFYKSEVERYQISDEDIEHLHRTISNVLHILRKLNPNAPIDTVEQLKELVSVDTLKAMQLLGFNYKAAIGEPLTEVCAQAILSLSTAKRTGKNAEKVKSKG